MKIRELDLKWITAIQITIAIIISLTFQFIIPFNWQPLDRLMHGPEVQHGDKNFVIFTLSQWYFSFSIAWLVYRDNPYINNFLVYSVITLSLIVMLEFFVLGLYWDYVHLTPFIVDCLILWKKKDTLYQKWLPHVLIFGNAWMFSVYFFKLAYYEEPIVSYLIRLALVNIVGIALSFTFRDGQGN